jgi:hypothetical protein
VHVVAYNDCAKSKPNSYSSDALLEKIVAARYNDTKSNETITLWDARWLNSTTVKIQSSGSSNYSNSTWSWNETWMRFSSNDAATAYLQTYNRTGYTYVSPNATTDNTYYNVTGRVPTVYQGYMKLSSVADASVYASACMQADDVIWIVEMNTTLR